MKTHFNIALMMTLACAGAFASTCHDVFVANKDAILTGQCLTSNGISFGIGQGIPRGSSSVHHDAASKKAQLAATINLVCRKSASKIVWPEKLERKYWSTLAALVSRELTLHAKIQGVETVYTAISTNFIRTAVVAVNEEALNAVPIATISDARRILLNPQWLKRNFRKNPEALYAFYISQKVIPEALCGTTYQSWTDEQLNIFCGLPAQVKPLLIKDSGEANDSIAEEDILPQFVLPPYAKANENETIGF